MRMRSLNKTVIEAPQTSPIFIVEKEDQSMGQFSASAIFLFLTTSVTFLLLHSELWIWSTRIATMSLFLFFVFVVLVGVRKKKRLGRDMAYIFFVVGFVAFVVADYGLTPMGYSVMPLALTGGAFAGNNLVWLVVLVVAMFTMVPFMYLYATKWKSK